MIQIDKNTKEGEMSPNSWSRVENSDGSFTVNFACPKGHEGELGDHTIDKDGKVEPSVVCPTVVCEECFKRVSNQQMHTQRTEHTKFLQCAFHDYIQLFGWSEVK